MGEEMQQRLQECAKGAAKMQEQLENASSQIEALTRQRDVLLSALYGVQGVMDESDGIAGWHLNGGIARWDEVLPEVGAAIEEVDGGER
jgi:hypothetical protein